MTRQELELALTKNGAFNELKIDAVSSLIEKPIFRITKVIFVYDDFSRPVIVAPEVLSNPQNTTPATLYLTADSECYIPVLPPFNYEQVSEVFFFAPVDSADMSECVIGLQAEADDGLILTVIPDINPELLEQSWDGILVILFHEGELN